MLGAVFCFEVGGLARFGGCTKGRQIYKRMPHRFLYRQRGVGGGGGQKQIIKNYNKHVSEHVKLHIYNILFLKERIGQTPKPPEVS